MPGEVCSESQSYSPDFKLASPREEISHGKIPWKNPRLTTEIHSLRQDYNYNTARQGFHYKWGLNLGGTQFFPAGANHGQVSSPLGIFFFSFFLSALYWHYSDDYEF